MKKSQFGEWTKQPKDADGTAEHPYEWPHVVYCGPVYEFISRIHKFVEAHPEMGLTDYIKILEEKELSQTTAIADVSGLDGRTVMAPIVSAVRAERFCDGALLNFLNTGAVQRWLLRLEELDTAERH